MYIFCVVLVMTYWYSIITGEQNLTEFIRVSLSFLDSLVFLIPQDVVQYSKLIFRNFFLMQKIEHLMQIAHDNADAIIIIIIIIIMSSKYRSIVTVHNVPPVDH